MTDNQKFIFSKVINAILVALGTICATIFGSCHSSGSLNADWNITHSKPAQTMEVVNE